MSTEELSETNSGSLNMVPQISKACQLLPIAILRRGCVIVTWSSVMYLLEALRCTAIVLSRSDRLSEDDGAIDPEEPS